MKNFARRIAIVVGATALSLGLLGTVSAPSDAGSVHPSRYDTSWPT